MDRDCYETIFDDCLINRSLDSFIEEIVKEENLRVASLLN